MGVVEVVVPEVEGLERVHEGTIVTVRGGRDEPEKARVVKIRN